MRWQGLGTIQKKRMVRQKDWNLAYWEMGAGEEVIEEASEGYTCLEKPTDKSGCLS